MNTIDLDSTHNTTASQQFKRLPKVAAILVVAAIYVIALLFNNTEEVKNFAVIFCSIMLEAAPFMLIGSFIGGLIEIFVSREKLLAIIPKGKILPVLMSAGLGLILPVCECAIVPVVRRLSRKGLPASAAIAYLLGGPAFNPIVAASTALAFRFDWRIVALRMIFGYMIAVICALVLQRILGNKIFIEEHSQHLHVNHEKCSHNNDHESVNDSSHHEHKCSCGCGHDHSHAHTSLLHKLKTCILHASDDFMSAGHYLIIGAFIAALAQTFLNRSDFISFSSLPILSVVLMMALAILLNLCSESDAFIAASMRGLVPLSAQMAFMLTGPIFDMKLLLMYKTIFKKRTILILSILIISSVLVISTAFVLVERYL